MKKWNKNLTEDLAKWPDYMCDFLDEKDITGYISTKVVKDLINERNKYKEKFEIIKEVLANGNLTGYRIQCPHCGVSYQITPQELNRGNVKCLDCGASYSQELYITGLVLRDTVSEEVREVFKP